AEAADQKLEDAKTVQQQAVTALEAAIQAKEEAEKALEAVQLDEAEALQAKAESEALLAQAKQAYTVAAEEKAAALEKEKQASADCDQAMQVVAEATADCAAKQAVYDAQKNALAAFEAVPGALTEKGVQPAMDLLAAASLNQPDVYAVYAVGQQLYFYHQGEQMAVRTRRARDARADVTITQSKNGVVAIRFVEETGFTRLQPLEGARRILFTGDYQYIRISTMVKGTSVYLGEACTADQVETAIAGVDVVSLGGEN
ncbi:MAG: hypothetical protein RR482_00975, partial [Clostridia bacterium]